MKLVTGILVGALIVLCVYSIVGTSGNVEKIKQLAPEEIGKREWKILRYEGFQFGSWSHHGGKVWYHVANINNPNIQYRVYITMWGDELQYTYGQPEILQRLDVNIK